MFIIYLTSIETLQQGEPSPFPHPTPLPTIQFTLNHIQQDTHMTEPNRSPHPSQKDSCRLKLNTYTYAVVRR